MDTMKIHALLLLGMVAAGAMTIGNAYAQTNTERLTQVASNTSSIIDTLDSIQATMAAALGSMADQMASIVAMVSGVDQKIDDVGSDVSHVADDVEHLIEDVEMMDSKIAEMMAANDARAAAQADQLAQSAMALPQMQSALDSIAANTANPVTTDVVAQNSAAIEALAETVDAMNARLDAINDSLGLVQQVVETPPPSEPSERAALSPASLKAYSSEFEFTVGTFGDSALKAPTPNTDLAITPDTTNALATRDVTTVQYTGSVSFECTGDVYVTSVETVNEEKMAYTLNDITTVFASFASQGNSTQYEGSQPDHAYGEIESVTIASPPRDVYYRNFDLHHGPNLYIDDASLDRALDMNYYPLEAGTNLDVTAVYREFTRTIPVSAADAHDVEARAYYDTDTGNDATEVPYMPRPVSDYVDDSFAAKSASGAPSLMTLKVDWTTADSDTKCAFAVTSDAPREMATKVDFYEVTGIGSGITKNFNTVIGCNDQKTTITDIVVSIPGLKLYDYANDFTMSVMEKGNTNADDKTKLTTWTFNSTGSYMNTADALPYELVKGNVLEFDGNVPDVDSLLVKVTYDTVKGNSCMQQ